MKEKLRTGIIGAGRWVDSTHLPGFRRSPLSEVVAICDPDLGLAEARAYKFGVDSVYTDYNEMLRKEDLDLVDV